MGRTLSVGLALAFSLICTAGRAAPDPAKQELARTGPEENVLLSPRDAMSDAMRAPGTADGDMEPAIVFSPGSAQLTPRATRILDRLGRALTAPDMAADRFRLEGHADGWGPPDVAHDLARRRAQAVANYLVENCSVVAARLDVAVASTRRPVRQVSVVDLSP